ncbi:hypothetical protein ACMYZ5_07905 [Bacteroides sp. KG68]|uniref:hypothetical protein n=1 Tax=unclassified Bacteroides TaxID=2646097 RepID=UPI003D969E7F
MEQPRGSFEHVIIYSFTITSRNRAERAGPGRAFTTYTFIKATGEGKAQGMREKSSIPFRPRNIVVSVSDERLAGCAVWVLCQSPAANRQTLTNAKH